MTTVLSSDAEFMANVVTNTVFQSSLARTYEEIFKSVDDLESILDDISGSHLGHPFWDMATTCVTAVRDLLIESLNPR